MNYRETIREDRLAANGELTPEQREEYTARIQERKKQMEEEWNRSSDMSAGSVHASNTLLRNLTSEILALIEAVENDEKIPTSLCLVPLEESTNPDTLKVVELYGIHIKTAIQEYNGLRVPVNQSAESYTAFFGARCISSFI